MPGRRRHAPTFALAAALVLAACGSSGGKASNDASVGPYDAALDPDAPTCAALPCLATATSLIASCAPGGTCTEQVTVSGNMSTQTKCFSNGVKVTATGTTLASGGTTMVMTVQKDGARCYSFGLTASADGSAGTGVYQDGAGADLLTESVTGATATYTCPGGSEIVPDSSCDAALFALQGFYPFTNGTCTMGICSF